MNILIKLLTTMGLLFAGYACATEVTTGIEGISALEQQIKNAQQKVVVLERTGQQAYSNKAEALAQSGQEAEQAKIQKEEDIYQAALGKAKASLLEAQHLVTTDPVQAQKILQAQDKIIETTAALPKDTDVRSEVQQELQKISQELQDQFVPVNQPGKPTAQTIDINTLFDVLSKKKWNQAEDILTELIEEKSDSAPILQLLQEVAEFVHQLPYKEQRIALDKIEKIINIKTLHTDSAIDQFAQQLQQRSGQLASFKPGLESPNILGKELKLNEYIPDDQVMKLKERLLSESISGQAAPDFIQQVEELIATYKLDKVDPAFTNMVRDLILPEESVETKAEQIEQQGNVSLLEQVGDVASKLFDSAKNGIQVGVDLLKQGVQLAADVAQKSTQVLVDAYAQQLANAAMKIESMANQVSAWASNAAKAPELLQKVIDSMKKLQDSIVVKGYLKANEKILSFAVGKKNIEKFSQKAIRTFNSVLDAAQQQETQAYVDQASAAGKKLQTITEGLRDFAQDLQLRAKELSSKTEKYVQEQIVHTRQARQAMKQLKIDILSFDGTANEVQKGVKKTFAEKFKAFFDAIFSGLKSMFVGKGNPYTTAVQKYTTVHIDFLSALGLKVGASPEEINNAMKVIQQLPENDAKQKTVTKLSQNVVQALADVLAVQNQYLNQLKGSVANADWLINGWDVMLDKGVVSQLNSAEKVKAAADGINNRIGAFAGAKEALAKMRVNLDMIAKDTPFAKMNSNAFDALSRIITTNYIEYVAEHRANLDQLGKQLDAYQQALEHVNS